MPKFAAFMLFIIKNMLLSGCGVAPINTAVLQLVYPEELGDYTQLLQFHAFSPPEAENNESNLLALDLI